MEQGKYSDVGYRFRENEFDAKDSWVPGVPSTSHQFYDLSVFNSDTLPVDENHHLIAQFFFRLEIDKIKHSRNVFSFMGWLGAIGGVEKILLKIMSFFLGGYASFHAAIETMNQQYTTKTAHHHHHQDHDDDDHQQPAVEHGQGNGASPPPPPGGKVPSRATTDGGNDGETHHHDEEDTCISSIELTTFERIQAYFLKNYKLMNLFCMSRKMKLTLRQIKKGSE